MQVFSIKNDIQTWFLIRLDAEKSLHAQLVSIGGSQSKGEEKMLVISKIVDSVVQKGQLGQRKVSDIQKLITDIRENLNKAKQELNKAVSVF